MNQIILEGLDETVYHEKLDNGLNIYVLRKKDYNTFSCYFITNFGALVDNFIPIGEKEYHKFPKGIAHFLEHKMFEEESGINVLEKFSSMQGACNAFTNYEYTAYYVNGVDNLKENLSFLLDYVQNPYFTDENVEKEKGIINQERLMTLDNPYRTFNMRILKNIFNNYEYGKSIVGEKDEIYSITKEDLYRCYNTFYNPSNMSVIVVSNQKEEDIINLIKENQSKKTFTHQDAISIKLPKEENKVNKEYDEFKDNVVKNEVAYSIKFNLNDINFDKDKLGIYSKILLISNFSKMSDFNLKLKQDGIINGNLGYSASKYKDFAIASVTASTNNIDKTIESIKDKFNNLDINEEKFNLLKKSMISDFVYSFTTTESIMNFLYSNYYENKEIKGDLFTKYKEINFEEYKNVIKSIDFSNVSITVMKPLKDKE